MRSRHLCSARSRATDGCGTLQHASPERALRSTLPSGDSHLPLATMSCSRPERAPSMLWRAVVVVRRAVDVYPCGSGPARLALRTHRRLALRALAAAVLVAGCDPGLRLSGATLAMDGAPVEGVRVTLECRPYGVAIESASDNLGRFSGRGLGCMEDCTATARFPSGRVVHTNPANHCLHRALQCGPFCSEARLTFVEPLASGSPTGMSEPAVTIAAEPSASGPPATTRPARSGAP